jgi:hypothetical protein
MTKLVYYLFLAFMLNFTFSPALAQARCYKSMADVLPCYLKEKVNFAVIARQSKARWQAGFVELSYESGGEDLIFTTDVLVSNVGREE